MLSKFINFVILMLLICLLNNISIYIKLEHVGNMDDYVGVRLPKELMDLVDEVIKSRKYGYRSRAEFVAEAVREKLARLGVIKA